MCLEIKKMSVFLDTDIFSMIAPYVRAQQLLG
ncbi:hypothetical protein SCAZ3_10655 [Streptococcus canis FSL Z3-227]|uniref:Uncharacterized protein n=1 Tax=Streptococcus canis FSL Z3-227 TaxID=482234 RepID=A0AAV3FUM0_STRCB|nr:hypothetical protein SCAZ3_10655 [Streptococcus canis FSL Z3-227]